MLVPAQFEIGGFMLTELMKLAISILIVAAGLLLVTRLLMVLFMRIARRMHSTYLETFLRLIQPQVYLLVCLVILNFTTNNLFSIPPRLKQEIDHLYFAVLVVICAVIVWKLIDSLVLWYNDLSKKSVDGDDKEAALKLAQRIGHILVIFVGLIVILDNYGVNVSALVATLGIGGLAVSLAAQDTLSNMVSGIMILMDKPFRLGDSIEIQGLNTSGDVVDIGLRSTRIRTSDNRMVIIPNSSISKNQVINYTYPDSRSRVQVDFRVAGSCDLKTVRDVVIPAVRSVEGVLAEKPVDVLLMEFYGTKMRLRARWWFESYSDSRGEYDRVNEAIYLALKEAGIETLE
jgi:MscS family membrane protein